MFIFVVKKEKLLI